MSHADFEIAYDGEALRNHSMDVDKLAPALIAVGELCKEANRVLNGERAAVSVLVKADFERACFSIHFHLAQSLYSHIKDLVSDDHVETAKTVLEWLGLLGAPSIVSLLGFQKWRKGRKIEGETRIVSKDGSVVYVIKVVGDQNTITIPGPVRDLANNLNVTRAGQAVVRPLLTDGIDTLEVRQHGAPIQSISKDEVGYFSAANDDEKFLDVEQEPQTIRTILQIRAPVFAEGEKWQFHFGEQKISALITDPAFLSLVFLDLQRFGHGDKMRVDMQIKQYETKAGNVLNSYTILRVLETWTAKEQPSLPLDPHGR